MYLKAFFFFSEKGSIDCQKALLRALEGSSDRGQTGELGSGHTKHPSVPGTSPMYFHCSPVTQELGVIIPLDARGDQG